MTEKSIVFSPIVSYLIGYIVMCHIFSYPLGSKPKTKAYISFRSNFVRRGNKLSDPRFKIVEKCLGIDK
jgi:hypothetical protein